MQNTTHSCDDIMAFFKAALSTATHVDVEIKINNDTAYAGKWNISNKALLSALDSLRVHSGVITYRCFLGKFGYGDTHFLSVTKDNEAITITELYEKIFSQLATLQQTLNEDPSTVPVYVRVTIGEHVQKCTFWELDEYLLPLKQLGGHVSYQFNTAEYAQHQSFSYYIDAE